MIIFVSLYYTHKHENTSMVCILPCVYVLLYYFWFLVLHFTPFLPPTSPLFPFNPLLFLYRCRGQRCRRVGFYFIFCDRCLKTTANQWCVCVCVFVCVCVCVCVCGCALMYNIYTCASCHYFISLFFLQKCACRSNVQRKLHLL